MYTQHSMPICDNIELPNLLQIRAIFDNLKTNFVYVSSAYDKHCLTFQANELYYLDDSCHPWLKTVLWRTTTDGLEKLRARKIWADLRHRKTMETKGFPVLFVCQKRQKFIALYLVSHEMQFSNVTVCLNCLTSD